MRAKGAVAGFVLAGGRSSRMGRDKALVALAGEPLLVRMARRVEQAAAPVTVIAPPERYADLGLRVVRDERPGLGPLGGIVTALGITPADWNLIVGCDLPYLTAEWLKFLVARARGSSAWAIVPETGRGLEPLSAVYHRRARPALVDALARGQRKLTAALSGLPKGAMERVPPADWKSFDSSGWLFKNMNEPADYDEAARRLAKRRE
jgi:molybdopterin-guanine dinucleotide biosynthesis protein A